MKKRFSIIIQVIIGILDILVAIVYFISAFAFFQPPKISCIIFGIVLGFLGILNIILGYERIKE